MFCSREKNIKINYLQKRCLRIVYDDYITLMMMMKMNSFCGMVDRRKAFSFNFSRDHCQSLSPSQIPIRCQQDLNQRRIILTPQLQYWCVSSSLSFSVLGASVLIKIFLLFFANFERSPSL